MENKKLVFAYWNCQALGHPTRLLLAYHNVDFDEIIYEEDDDWFKRDKPTLNTPFPNLPYIKDGDNIVTESSAVIQYAALKTGKEELLGKNHQDAITAAQIAGVLRDLLKEIFTLASNKEFATVKDKVLEEKIAPFFDKLSKALGEKEYCLGYLTYVDFQLAYIFDVAKRINAETMKKWANLEKHHDRIYGNEGIQKYRKSKNYQKCFEPPGYLAWDGEETI